MSQPDMSGYMEKLLDGVEVEWKALGEVCDFKNGFAFKSSLFKEAGLPIVRITNVDGKNISLADVKYFDPSDYKENTASYEVSKGDILIAMSGATTGKIGFYAHENPAYLNQRVGKFLPKPKILNNRYLYHYLLSKVEQIYVVAGGGAQPNLSSNALMAKIKIPIPCPDSPEKSLEIQAEIVRILDAFTAMTAELTAELNLRKQQYNYYRDQLLRFEEGEVGWKNLEDVASFRRGSFPQPYGNSEWYDGEGCMPFVQVADVADFGFRLHQKTKQQISRLAQPKSVFVEKDTVIVSLQGTIGRVAITQYDCYVDRTLAIFTNYKVDINKKYFAHQLKAKFDLEKEFARGSTLKTITKEEFSKFQIPIPPIEEQNRIVSLLDKFDVLTHSIKEGLPREIELRQKQYEYYRDLLLSFPRPKEEAVA
ncbi:MULTISPECIES: restriction endonuclease subunit S [Thalassolituus]|uniref:restriction endonuclease subunit S n=1 Tax=Thalassolituus TaxID=187492 RepID=UPI0026471053|nr:MULTISPECIES: restriction endonuclease subunit S [Thalassolituus]|tara:strand:+ start:54 stop:1322 length:1269 start_codon:yes stop_codon:yes gene_type:complete